MSHGQHTNAYHQREIEHLLDFAQFLSLTAIKDLIVCLLLDECHILRHILLGSQQVDLCRAQLFQFLACVID